MKTNVRNYQVGFTLIEYIVVLVIAAIMAAIVYTFMGSALTQSSAPIERLKQSSNLNLVMENIVADYNRLNRINLRYKWRSGTKYSIDDVVLPSDSVNNSISKIANNGRYYKCTQAGTSNTTTLPGWTITTPPINGTPFTDGTVTWQEQGYVWKAGTTYPTGSIVVPAISNGHYYKGGGTSGATDPATLTGRWPTTTGGTVSDGILTWTEAGTILSRTTAAENEFENLYDFLATSTRYGTGYTVTEKVFVKFDPSTYVEATISGTEEKNILKVAIKNNESNETLRDLFTIR